MQSLDAQSLLPFFEERGSGSGGFYKRNEVFARMIQSFLCFLLSRVVVVSLPGAATKPYLRFEPNNTPYCKHVESVESVFQHARPEAPPSLHRPRHGDTA